MRDIKNWNFSFNGSISALKGLAFISRNYIIPVLIFCSNEKNNNRTTVVLQSKQCSPLIPSTTSKQQIVVPPIFCIYFIKKFKLDHLIISMFYRGVFIHKIMLPTNWWYDPILYICLIISGPIRKGFKALPNLQYCSNHLYIIWLQLTY